MEQGDESMPAEHGDDNGRFATDIIPIQIRNRKDYLQTPSRRSTKKTRPTLDAKRAVDECPKAQVYKIHDSDMGSPSMLPTGCDIKKQKTENDLWDLSSLRILPVVLQALDIIEA